MKSILHFVTLSIYLTSTNTFWNFSDIRRSLISEIRRYKSQHLKNNDYSFDIDGISKYGPWVQEKEILRTRPELQDNDKLQYSDVNEIADRNDIMMAREKALVLHKAKGKEAELNELNVIGGGDANNHKLHYHMDPVFNLLRSVNLRRGISEDEYETPTESESSSRELGDFKEQFRDLWMQKKYSALHSQVPKGDQVMMTAART